MRRLKYVTGPLLAVTLFLPMASEGQRFQANYDEAKVPKFKLKEPLAFGDGITRDAKVWEEKLRPVTLDLIGRQMYGHTPAAETPLSFSFEMDSEVDDACGGTAIRREYVVTFSHEKSPKIRLLLYLPKGARNVPAFLGLNFRGNHTVEKDPRITLGTSYVLGAKKDGDNTALAEKNRGSAAGRWPAAMIVERGYALATVCCGDIDPDYDDGFGNGVHAMFPKPKAHEWGTISAWAWGLSRMRDVLEQVREVDGSRVAVIGHSRLGKTSLWAGAQDQRIAMAISNDSGCGGAALSKRAFGETVGRINRSFPHWFNQNFKKYNENEEALPFDQHQLVACLAPRPVYVASATGDRWADPKGEFLSLVHGEQAYMLYNDVPFGVKEQPEPGKSVGNLMGYHLREGKHDITPEDWGHYLDFADKWLKKEE